MTWTDAVLNGAQNTANTVTACANESPPNVRQRLIAVALWPARGAAQCCHERWDVRIMIDGANIARRPFTRGRSQVTEVVAVNDFNASFAWNFNPWTAFTHFRVYVFRSLTVHYFALSAIRTSSAPHVNWIAEGHDQGQDQGLDTCYRACKLFNICMWHYVLTASDDIVVCFHTGVCLSC